MSNKTIVALDNEEPNLPILLAEIEDLHNELWELEEKAEKLWVKLGKIYSQECIPEEDA